MPNEIELTQQGTESTTIVLTPEQGQQIKDLILKESKMRFSTYLIRVGFSSSNVSALLTGRKRISLKALNKLLSGLENWNVECRTEFVVRKASGDPAQNVSSPSLDDELFLEEMGLSQEEQ